MWYQSLVALDLGFYKVFDRVLVKKHEAELVTVYMFLIVFIEAAWFASLRVKAGTRQEGCCFGLYSKIQKEDATGDYYWLLARFVYGDIDKEKKGILMLLYIQGYYLVLLIVVVVSAAVLILDTDGQEHYTARSESRYYYLVDWMISTASMLDLVSTVRWLLVLPEDEESNKPLIKDEDRVDVDVHVYRSMIGSLMYLTASRTYIMFAVCTCARDSPFELEAFSDSDYGCASLDRKSTIGGCQFLGRRLISWQCKKQTIMANSTTEAEYVAAANCYGQVLWIQNQMMDYGFNFMNTKIYIDNESTICIVKNHVYHSRTKHIEIRHHFIMDCVGILDLMRQSE
ncbi:hypothetical protein Tco_0813419 [Tanacetum coccineum]